MSVPTDGYGVYDYASPLNGSSYWQPRLRQIAAGGFKVVLNASGMHGHMSDLQAYIAYAVSLGLKVIVPVHDPAIWKTGTYATTYPEMYADAGQPSTGLALAQWVLQQTNGTTGVYGYYLGDEITQSDAGLWQPYASGLASYRNGLPRLVVESASSAASAFYSGTSIAIGYCEMGMDDWYPVGDDQISWPTMKTVASGIQATCTANSMKSGVVLQCFSWAQFTPPNRSPVMNFPTVQQMYQHRVDAISNMTPQLVLCWAYNRATQTIAPAAPSSFWPNVCMAVNQIQGAWV